MTRKESEDTIYIDKDGLDFLRQKKVGVEEAQIYAGKEQGSFFVFVTGPESGNVAAINKPRITIGRDSGADIVINRQFVSKVHAKVVTTEGKATIVDLGSTNGTYVNDKPIKTARLQDQDEIQVGNIIIKYFQMNLRDQSPAPMGKIEGGAGSEFYKHVLNECKPFFGRMAAQFLNRQVTAHIGKNPQTVSVNDKDELVKWIKISAALLLDDNQAETLSNIVSLLR